MKQWDLTHIDRRVIYLLVLLALSIPLALEYALKPARMEAAERAFAVVQDLEAKPGELAFMSLDFGPNSLAENKPQAEVVLEHLLRKRIPVALYSQYYLAEPFLESIPKTVVGRLEKEILGHFWEYGRDWVNLGYRPGGSVMLQNIAKSADLAELFKTDARGNNLRELPIFKGVAGLESVKLLAEFTSLVGGLDSFLQFFQKKGYRPFFIHGCTSITIPQAFIYLDSGQLKGLLEGIAGAAWYSLLLERAYPQRRPDAAQIINTGLGVAHMVVIALVLLGNVGFLIRGRN